MKKILIRLSLVFGLFLLILFFAKRKSSKNIDYLKKVNLQLTGIVTDVVKLKQEHGYGIISLDVISSSIKNYDERTSREAYLGIIKGDKAEIVVTFTAIVKKKDSIIIDGINYKVFRKNKLIKKGKWDLPFDLMRNPYIEISKKLKLY